MIPRCCEVEAEEGYRVPVMQLEAERSDPFRTIVTRSTLVTVGWIAMLAYSAAMWFLLARTVVELVR